MANSTIKNKIDPILSRDLTVTIVQNEFTYGVGLAKDIISIIMLDGDLMDILCVTLWLNSSSLFLCDLLEATLQGPASLCLRVNLLAYDLCHSLANNFPFSLVF
ncbi:MAG: hypothetical protein FWD28_07935 [Treponema sp.]|nr:hypothetical protein [Treponema sp.]